MFPADTLYSKNFMQMNKACQCCGQSFEPEPGFYLGVMYTSYILHAILFVLLIFAFYQIVGSRNLFSLGLLFLLAVLALLPITFRFARSIWIHLWVRYEGPCNQIPKIDR